MCHRCFRIRPRRKPLTPKQKKRQQIVLAAIVGGIIASAVGSAISSGIDQLNSDYDITHSADPTQAYLKVAQETSHLFWSNEQWINFAAAVCRDKRAGVSENLTAAQALPAVGETYEASQKIVHAAITAYCPGDLNADVKNA